MVHPSHRSGRCNMCLKRKWCAIEERADGHRDIVHVDGVWRSRKPRKLLKVLNERNRTERKSKYYMARVDSRDAKSCPSYERLKGSEGK